MNLRKNNNFAQSGFTLAETLIAMLIMLMVTAIVAAGIPVAQRAYAKVTRTANAQVALSTTITALQNELGTARDIEVDSSDNSVITYYSSRINNKARISKHNNMIWLEEYWVDLDDPAYDTYQSLKEGKDFSRSLISKSMVGKDIYVTYKYFSYNSTNNIVTIHYLGVYPKSQKENSDTEENSNTEENSDTAIVELDKLDINVLAPSHV